MSKPRSRTLRSAEAATTSPELSGGLQRALSSASASWIAYVGRLQEETIHFAGAWLGRCLETADRFARCQSFADVVDAQAQFISDLLSDFVDEGAIFASALCESAAKPPAAAGKR